MMPINNSDLTWLILADYNQDNDILGADDLREDIYCPIINHWHYDHLIGSPQVGTPHVVGSDFNGEVGDITPRVGTTQLDLPFISIGCWDLDNLVGGNPHRRI